MRAGRFRTKRPARAAPPGEPHLPASNPHPGRLRRPTFGLGPRAGSLPKRERVGARFSGLCDLASLRRDAAEQVRREEWRRRDLLDRDTGELLPEVEAAAGLDDPFGLIDVGEPDLWGALQAAIAALPPEQARIIELLGAGMPIDSKDPHATTIARVLQKSEKTIRTHRDKAFARLRAELGGGEPHECSRLRSVTGRGARRVLR